MLNWIFIHDVSTNGFRLNRVWHLRQGLFMISIPFGLYLTCRMIIAPRIQYLMKNTKEYYDSMKDEVSLPIYFIKNHILSIKSV